jgi:hypothetical protein
VIVITFRFRSLGNASLVVSLGPALVPAICTLQPTHAQILARSIRRSGARSSGQAGNPRSDAPFKQLGIGALRSIAFARCEKRLRRFRRTGLLLR